MKHKLCMRAYVQVNSNKVHLEYDMYLNVLLSIGCNLGYLERVVVIVSMLLLLLLLMVMMLLTYLMLPMSLVAAQERK